MVDRYADKCKFASTSTREKAPSGTVRSDEPVGMIDLSGKHDVCLSVFPAGLKPEECCRSKDGHLVVHIGPWPIVR